MAASWHKAPLELPSHWQVLTFFKRGLMLEYRRLAAARDGSVLVPFTSDPARFLVMQLNLADRKDRAPAVRSTLQLFEEGLLTLKNGHVYVQDKPEEVQGYVQDRDRQETKVPQFCTQSVRIPESNPANSHESSFTDRERDKSRESESARTHTREVIHFRIPVGEPPPELPAAEPPLAHTIVQAHAAEYAKRSAGLKAPSDYTAAKLLAEWCEAGAAAYGTDAKTLALRCVAALFAHPRAGAARWPLHWMVGKHDTTEFAGLPSGVKPVARVDVRSMRETLEEARERTSAAAKTVSRLSGAPWFDRKWIDSEGVEHDRKSFLESVAAAEAELKAARAAEQELRGRMREAS